jgi:hypothetical protein
MSRLSISARDMRALRVGALAILPVLTFQLVVTPYSSAMSRRKDELRAERALLARELRVLQERAQYDTLGVEAQRLLAETEQLLFIGTDELSVSATLTRHVSDQARLAPVLIQQIEAGSAITLAEQLGAIDVVVRGESDLEGILTFLRGLEFGAKLFTIPAFRVEPVTAGEPDPEEPALLGFSATLRAYVLLRPVPASDSARSGS